MRQQEEEPDVCCICLDELPTDANKLIRATCCGKQWHIGCQNNVMKSTMPDELKNRCHQCRKPIPTTDKEAIEQLREWLDKGEAWAQRMMGQWYRDGECGLKQSYVMAATLWEKAIAQLLVLFHTNEPNHTSHQDYLVQPPFRTTSQP